MDKINTVSKNTENKDEHSADLDQALAVAGVGLYNVKYCGALSLFLIAAILEPVGYSFVLPAAMCDLNMTSSQRGLIASIPYIGIVLTSFPWGYLVDTRGRKKVVIYSAIICGLFSILSAFMPDLISFAVCKILSSLCLACPAAAPYTYISEILPARYRDVSLSITNSIQLAGAALVPLLAWGILPLDISADFGSYIFRPWRILTMVYASAFLLGALFLFFGPESPKYLVSQGKLDEALDVVRIIYAGNKRKSPEDFPIKKLLAPPNNRQKLGFFTSLKVQSWPLLKPPYLKWMACNGFLLFGVFSAANGLYMWVPDVLNRVLSGDEGGKTACQVIYDRLNQTAAEDAECDDKIDQLTFVISSVANVSIALIAMLVSSFVQIIGKKVILIVVFLLIGTLVVLINFITQDMIFAVLLSSVALTGLAVGPINAYSVEIFPTHLRGMAVGLSMMIGRMGSIFGANVAGILLNLACEITFYGFGGLLIICGIITLFLPKSKRFPKKTTENLDVTKI